MPKAAARPLTTFVQDAKRAKCPVCKLSASIRAQIRTARAEHNVSLATVVLWLKKEHGIELTIGNFSSHTQGKHE